MSGNQKYDLDVRILQFIRAIIEFIRGLSQDTFNQVLIRQIIRFVTSIGANYKEADGSRSKKEFVAIMGIVKKEAKETKYWLKVLRLANSSKYHSSIDSLMEENEELIRIFAKKIIINSNKTIQ